MNEGGRLFEEDIECAVISPSPARTSTPNAAVVLLRTDVWEGYGVPGRNDSTR